MITTIKWYIRFMTLCTTLNCSRKFFPQIRMSGRRDLNSPKSRAQVTVMKCCPVNCLCTGSRTWPKVTVVWRLDDALMQVSTNIIATLCVLWEVVTHQWRIVVVKGLSFRCPAKTFVGPGVLWSEPVWHPSHVNRFWEKNCFVRLHVSLKIETKLL